MAERKIFHYDAFISYRHAELDKLTAVGLHRRLESFRMPGGLREDLPAEKRRIRRVFRDQDELPLSSNLSDAIENALRNTDWLIVIATPRFPESKWCAREIERFTELYGQDHILVVLAEGTPEESIPEVLRFRKNGAVDEIAADVRTEEGAEGRRQDRRKLLDDAALKIAARMYGLPYEELKRRVRERRFRRIAAACAGTAAVLLAFSMYCAAQFALISRQKNLIGEQKAELQVQYEAQREKYQDSMAATARRLSREGRRMDALYAAYSAVVQGEQAFPGDPDDSGGLASRQPGTSAEKNSGAYWVMRTELSASLQECLSSLLHVYDRNTLVLENLMEAPPADDPFWNEERKQELEEQYGFLKQYVPQNSFWTMDELPDGRILMIPLDGEISLFVYDPAQGFLDDVTGLWFSEVPSGITESAVYREDRLYLKLQSVDRDSMVCYGWKSIGDCEQAGTVLREELPQRRLKKLEKGQELISGDGKYRAVIPEEDPYGLAIYEKDGTEPVRVLHDLEGSENGIYGMERLEGTDLYVIIGDTLRSWILNPELEIIARVPGYYGYDPERQALIQYGAARSLDENAYPLFYRPLKNEEELLSEAAALLGGWRPSPAALEHYRIRSW